MLIDMARERAIRAIRESLLAARTLAALEGNTQLIQQVDDALRSLDSDGPTVIDRTKTLAGPASDLSAKVD